MGTARLVILESPSEKDSLDTAVLRGQGYVCESVTTVGSALDVVSGDGSDLVLLDLSVGEAACRELLAALGKGGGGPRVPVVVVAEDEEVAKRLLDLGTDEVIRRPRSAAALAEAVRLLLELVRLRRELTLRSTELQCMTSQLAHTLEMKSRFLDLASHDLRTPVTTIKLVHDILTKQVLPTAGTGVRRVLDILARNVAKIEGKIEELLLIARMNIDEIEIRISEVDLNRVVEDAVASFFPGAIGRGVDLDAVFSEVRPLHGDARRLGQLISELIACCLDRLDAGQRIIVETREEGKGAMIRVSDNGAPLPPDRIEEMLAGLENADPSSQTRASLYAAYQIARRHGGHLDIRSPEGMGAAFVVWLPFQPGQGLEGGGSDRERG